MPGSKPNIILILADDMGFSDIGCYGSEISTPNLDTMARNGVLFSQAYNCARCCPTRASLLTGLYPHQAGIGHMVRDLGLPGYRGRLRDDCLTIAEALRLGGYRTYLSGKWHVAGHCDPMRPEAWHDGGKTHPLPRQRGFDRFYGIMENGSYFCPFTLMRDDTVIEPEGDDYYFTDAITDEALKMIDGAAESGEPFFLFVSHTAPHWPLHAWPEDIAKYEGKYRRDGWDGTRTARHEELKGLRVLDSKWAISPRDEKAPEWSQAAHRDWEDRRMAVYAAQVDRMDQGIGRIMDRLAEQNIVNDTMVLFLSDNGGCAEFLAENGWVEVYSTFTPGDEPARVGNIPGIKPGDAHTFMSYDLPWANASNSPFRLYKHWVHEGGIATPLIVHWPNTVGQKRIVHDPCHVIDIMATCLDAAGVPYPENHSGKPITPLEGESLVPALRGGAWKRVQPLFWEHEGNRAVRSGEWKLVGKCTGGWELYNMNEDRTELNDLCAVNRSKVRELAKLYDEWAKRCGVEPWDRIFEMDQKIWMRIHGKPMNTT